MDLFEVAYLNLGEGSEENINIIDAILQKFPQRDGLRLKVINRKSRLPQTFRMKSLKTIDKLSLEDVYLGDTSDLEKIFHSAQSCSHFTLKSDSCSNPLEIIKACSGRFLYFDLDIGLTLDCLPVSGIDARYVRLWINLEEPKSPHVLSLVTRSIHKKNPKCEEMKIIYRHGSDQISTRSTKWSSKFERYLPVIISFLVLMSIFFYL